MTTEADAFMDVLGGMIGKEEREACAKLLEQPVKHLNPTECCADKAVQTLRGNFQNLAKALRNRERKE